jgi:hypothetical protein
MKLRTVLLALTLSTAVAQLNAAPITFSGFLTGPNEEPPNASPGTGTALVTIDDVAHTLRVQVTFSDLLAGVTAAHIHIINGPGDNDGQPTLGPVATTTPTFPGFPSGVTFGAYDMTFDTTLASSYRAQFITDAGGTTAAAEAALFAGIIEGRAYLNIHTTQFTGGEIRDFLEPVPEPETAFLVAAALLALIAVRRRTKDYVR